MKVLHVSTAKSWRGGEQQIAYLYEELAALGVEQIIVCRKGSEMHRHCQQQNISHHALSKRTSVDPFFAWQIARVAKKHHTNIVHPHDSHSHTFAIMAASLFGMDTPIVLHRRVAFPVKDSKFSKLKYNHPQIRRIICISHEVKRILDQSLDDRNKSVVIHSGIDISRFIPPTENILRKEYGITGSKMLIGNIAAITAEKGYTTFVETARILLEKRKDIHFFIIGSGDQLEETQQLTKKYKLQDHFTFTGFRKDISKVLPCLDLLLFTSEKEGLGTTLLDAFAAKVAVVSTNAGGIPELVEHGQNGYLANVKDPEALAGFVEKLLNSDKTREQFLKSAFQKVQAFDKSEMAAQVLKVYRESSGK